jgi:hypothetical protein
MQAFKGTKNIIFWDTTPCSLLKVNRSFRGTYRLHLLGRISRARYQCKWRWQAEMLLMPLTFNGLYHIISQKIVLVLTAAIGPSNPTYLKTSSMNYYNIISSQGLLQREKKTKFKQWNMTVLTERKQGTELGITFL